MMVLVTVAENTTNDRELAKSEATKARVIAPPIIPQHNYNYSDLSAFH